MGAFALVNGFSLRGHVISPSCSFPDLSSARCFALLKAPVRLAQVRLWIWSF